MEKSKKIALVGATTLALALIAKKKYAGTGIKFIGDANKTATALNVIAVIGGLVLAVGLSESYVTTKA